MEKGPRQVGSGGVGSASATQSLTAGIITGIFAFVGVLVAQLVAVVLDRIRTSRDDARRWHAERREVYARFVGYFNDAAKVLYDGWSSPEAFDIATFTEFDAVMRIKVELHLLATRSVRDASDRMAQSLEEVCRLRKMPDRTRLRQETFAHCDQMQEAFFAAARAELLVKE